MLLFLLKALGWLTAHTPEPLLRALSAALGDVVFYLGGRRRRLVRSNLHHAFPERTPEWRDRIGREGCRRLFETGLLSLATPYLTPERLRMILRASPDLEAVYHRHATDPAPSLICSPHLAYWETQTAKPLVLPSPFPEFGIIYRPLDNPAADAFVKAARERFGMKLLSRRDGFAEALKILRRRGFVGVLFDQNAGLQGALTTLFGRVCSTTELPGLMAEKFNARVLALFPRRLGFWRIEVGVEEIVHDGSSNAVTLGLNRWLERTLSADDNLCASWLWSHDRWRHQDMPSKRLRLESKRDLLAIDLAARGMERLPHRTRILVRLPNWLGDVVMALPLLRAIRAGRPDAELTLIARAPFAALLREWGVADRVEPLPPRGLGYWSFFRRMRDEHPDCHLLFTNSFRGDLEAWLAGSRQRFGIVRAGKYRPLLSHAYRPAPGFDEAGTHQLELWRAFLAHFGLTAEADCAPIFPATAAKESPIGLITGSENTPGKRWPVARWRELIAGSPANSFVLFGTATDAALTREIAAGFPSGKVADLAGKTDLPTFAAKLRACRLLVTNDTGGMHLANALGVPVVALFGPTNPVRTGPVFAAPRVILQAPGSSPTGGGRLADLEAETVLAAVRPLLS
ncbi:MAG: glycosyltransferase family 9 protein [Opitutaceae bacterium]